MKPTAHMIAGLFLIASIAASCDSCNKKRDAGPTDNATITTTETMPDTTITADASSIAEPAASATNANSKAANATTKNTGKSKDDASKAGYSAADGTDAENSDGDQYTKNDQKPMPTGPPMK